MSRKVTLIMPCYNAEPYIDVMLASVYGQIHDDIELICVDDGSTDHTRAKLDAWKPLMEKRGYSMIIASKENGGAASAINVGLGLFSGKYVCFPDADDMLMPGYVSEMLVYLEEHPTVGWVTCDCLVSDDVEANNVVLVPEYLSTLQESARHLPEQYLALRTCLGVWRIMVRSGFLRQSLPEMRLDEGWSGQEYQILLPLAAQAPCAYLNKPLYFYIRRSTGFMGIRILAGYTQAVSCYGKLFAMAKSVIKKLNVSPEILKKWEQLCDISLNAKRIMLAVRFEQTELAAQLISEQLELLTSVLGAENYSLPSKVLPDKYFMETLTHCAVDRLIYTPEELRASVTTEMIKLRKTLSESRLFLYGAGVGGVSLLSWFLFVGIKPECIWDSNAGKLDKDNLFGVPILPPDFDGFTPQEKLEMVVVVAIIKSEYIEEVVNLLNANGIKRIFPFDEVSLALSASVSADFCKYKECPDIEVINFIK